LHQAIKALPPGHLRDEALEAIQRLDCSNPDKTVASCNPSIPIPPEAAAWRKSLEDATVDEATFAKTLALVLKMLVCSGDENAGYVLRGLSSMVPTVNRILAIGSEAPALIDFIMSKDCPISTSLTDADKAKLLRIKQEAINVRQRSVTGGAAYSP
jgi:hypothetical protein